MNTRRTCVLIVLKCLKVFIPSEAFWRIHWEWAHQTPAVSAGAVAWMDVDVWKKDKDNFNYKPGDIKLHEMFAMRLNSLAQSHEALFNDVSLGLCEGSSTRQPVDCVQHWVNHYGSVVTASKERGTLGDEWQHSRTQVAVQSEGHLCGAESNLLNRYSKQKVQQYGYNPALHFFPRTMYDCVFVNCLKLTVSREAAALMSGRKPTSSTWSRKSWLSIPYTLSRNRTMGALWSGTKLADIFGSMMLLSKHDIKKTFRKNH